MKRKLKKFGLFLIIFLCSMMPVAVLAQQDSETGEDFLFTDNSVESAYTEQKIDAETGENSPLNSVQSLVLPQLVSAAADMSATSDTQIVTQAISGEYEYIAVSGGIAITKYKGGNSQVIIPDTLDGQPVVEIASYALYSNGIYKNIIIGSNVTTIRANAIGNYSLQTVTIPATTTVIEANAISASSAMNMGLKVIGTSGSAAQDYVRDAGLENLIFVDQNSVENGFWYVIEEDGAKLVHYEGNADTLVLPATLGGKPLVTVGSYAIVDSALTRFESNSELKKIEEFAFSGCSPYGVGYNNLEILLIPSGSTEIIKSTDSGDYSLNALKRIIGKSGSIAESFATANHITFLVIGNFQNYYWYETVTDGVKISYYEGSDSILTIPETLAGLSVVAIGSGAFADRDLLTEVTVPDSVTSLEDSDTYSSGIFSGCDSLEKLMIGKGVTQIPSDMAYSCTKLKEVIFNGSVKSIGNRAFWRCYNLQSINLPESLESIGNAAFLHCDGISSITIPDKTSVIGSGVFVYCKKLTSLRFGSGLISLGDQAAAWCDSLETVSIPEGLTTIGSLEVFRGCPLLSKVEMPESVSAITTNIFEYSPNTSIYGLTGSYIETYADKYDIPFVSDGEAPKGELSGFIGQDPTGSYFLYNKTDFNNAYLAYQINPDLAAAKMYQHFLNQKCQIVALKDLRKGYMDYSAAATASLLAQMKGETFDVGAYFGRSDAKLYEKGISSIGNVDKDGNIH